jgi:hypothetical protein
VGGRIKSPHSLVLTELLGQIDGVDDTRARVDAQIEPIWGPFAEAVGLLDPLPGVARRTAERRVAENRLPPEDAAHRLGTRRESLG